MNLIRTCRSLVRRWNRDTRGSSMLTTAVTMPLLLVILFGIWYIFWWLAVKQALHLGVTDAARYATEEGRYWNVDPNNGGDADHPLLPKDFYDMQARRMVENRLRDINNWSTQTMATSLVVRVDEPILANSPDKAVAEAPVQEGYFETLCDPAKDQIGDYRVPENIRLRIYAELNLPFFPVKIPYMEPVTVTLSDRAIGYVQCPRWTGVRQAGVDDQSKDLAAEKPFMQFRFPSMAIYPTVTAGAPAETPTPVSTP